MRNFAPLLCAETLAAHAPLLGLHPEETQRITRILDRFPSECELGIFSAIWSEHCSYKSSRVWLSTLHTIGSCVIHGPGENAGVIDIGDNQAIAFKMESHNHPSYIEPYQGAATGVGGILRDVFTMGARPIATLNALRFGAPSHPKTRSLVRGVVAGIGGYGNSFGVPTVAGEVNFDPAYNGNILVNAMAVGLLEADKIFLSKAAGVGNPLLYVGAATGKDGIHGASMASANFEDDVDTKRPTVQVGDPFTGKILCDASLALMQEGLVIAVQDMGAAGLTSSSVEMASKGAVGVRLDLDCVPQRAENMSAFEIMLSESQERMLMVIKAGAEQRAMEILQDYALNATIIGEITDTRHLQVVQHGTMVADIPVDVLVDNAPVYHREYITTPAYPPLLAEQLDNQPTVIASLTALLKDVNLASKRWIYQQYDSLIRSQTLCGPEQSDAAIIGIPNYDKAIAVCCDCTPHYVLRAPKIGAMQAVCETYRNLVASGAKPLAVTNNLNFASPEVPEIMGQFVDSIEGIRTACAILDYPVVSGNVSLYNATGDQPIMPTPVIGAVGLLEKRAHALGLALRQAGSTLVLLGATHGELGASHYARLHGLDDKASPPAVDPYLEKRHAEAVQQANHAGLLLAAHDVSDGGLLVAIAKMALAGGIGITLQLELAPAFWFAEDQARYLLLSDQPEELYRQFAGLPCTTLGIVGGDALVLANGEAIALKELEDIHAYALEHYMQQNPPSLS